MVVTGLMRRLTVSDWLPQLIFQTAYLQTKRLGRRQTKTAHGGLQRSCGSVREIWQKRKLSLPLFLKRSLPPSISLQANWAEPCQHWEGALMTAACECMCVRVSARDRGRKMEGKCDGKKRDVRMLARLSLPELASKEWTDVPAVTLDR